MLTFKLLGEATIIHNDKPITGIGSRTAEALLIYLVCAARPFSRQYLAEFFWEEREPEQSAANLRAALSLLRKQVGDYVLVTRQMVAFNSDLPFYLDVAEFKKQAAVGEGNSPDHPALTRLQDAIALYAGSFLDGFYLRDSRAFEEWSLLQREQLQQQATWLLRRLLAELSVMQDTRTALGYADLLLRLNPISEFAHQQKMLLLAREGQFQAALRQYRACQTLLQEELGVEPNPETAVLAQRIQRASQTSRHNLPPFATPFIGRQQELADLEAQLLNPHYRLLTITGPGGVGKTRLALEAARRLIPTGHFLNGLRFVTLAQSDAPTRIPGLIAAELGLSFHGQASPEAQLAAALAGEEMLLVLDNLEHLMEGEAGEATAVLLAQLLAVAPLLTLLVTSRQRLYLQEEWLFDVKGLDLPKAASSMADAASADAVQLFLQMARRVQREFEPNEADMAAIVVICRALDGLPLAIELAAAWLRQLSCPAIAARLTGESGQDLLTSSLRNVPPRHRSMTAVFDHSWALLNRDEQTIFARLSQFRSGFTVAAATAVTQATPAILHSLLDQSLLRLKPGSANGGQYNMHPLLRQFAADRLATDPVAHQQIVAAHGRYFAQLVSTQESQLHGPAEQAQLELLRAMLPDLRAAWQWATSVIHEDSRPLDAMLGSLAYLYDVQALYGEGVELLQTAVAQLAAATTPDLLAQKGRLLSWHGRFLYHLDQYDTARDSMATAVALLRPLNRPANLALALTFLGELARFEQAFSLAHQYQAESAALAQAAGADDVAALVWLHTGKINVAEGDYQAARQMYEVGLSLAQRSGAPRQIATLEDNLGTVALELGDYAMARQKFSASYELRRILQDQWGLGASLNNLGVLALITGDYDAAVDNYRQAEAIFRQMGHALGLAMSLTNLGRALAYQHQYSAAQESLNQALGLWRKMEARLEEGDAWLYLGQIALQRGDYALAQTQLGQSLALFTALDDERQLAVIWRELGVTLTYLGEMVAAQSYLQQSLTFALRQEITQDVVYALAGWAVWYRRSGKTAVARQLFQLAATHPAAWHHERQEAQQQLAALGGAPDGVQDEGTILGLEAACQLVMADYRA